MIFRPDFAILPFNSVSEGGVFIYSKDKDLKIRTLIVEYHMTLMPLNLLISLFPFAFALHNLEEVLGMEKYTHSIPSGLHKPVTTRQFGIAVVLFTLLGFLVVFLKSPYPSERIYYFVISGLAGMLFLNVFVPHLIATIYFRKYSPGIITALLFNLPLTSRILWLIKKSGIQTSQQIILAVLSGGLIGVTLVFIFLKIGKIVDNKLTN